MVNIISNRIALLLALTCALLSGGLSADEGPATQPTLKRDFGFVYWLNGMRKNADDTSPDILCVETGHYGFSMDVADLTKVRFGEMAEGGDYQQALQATDSRLAKLPQAELRVEVEVEGVSYRAKTSAAAVAPFQKRLKHARMWEAGRLVQHMDLEGLVFKDKVGNTLQAIGTLDIVSWPDSLTMTAKVSPSQAYRDGLQAGAVGNGHCIVAKPLDFPHDPTLDHELMTLECWFLLPEKLAGTNNGWIVSKNSNEWEEGNFGFQLQQDIISAVMNIGGGRGNQYIIRQAEAVKHDTWQHLALSYDGTIMRHYLNGELQGEKAIKKPRRTGTGNLRIGQRADGVYGAGPAPIVKGLYDQVRIWDRALSQAEIQAHASTPAALPSRDGLTFDQAFDQSKTVAFPEPQWTDARLHISLQSGDQIWQNDLTVSGAWRAQEKRQISVTCQLAGALRDKVSLAVSAPSGQAFPVHFEPTTHSHVATVRDLKRDFAVGNTDIRDYDDFAITITRSGESAADVPFLLDFYGIANATGLTPILCDADGVPTGIPVQLSKNWHYRPLGLYLRAYAKLPAKTGTTRYILRVVYGFYGTLPAASHAQLSLIGYGGNGRWDQLAIGCWGETICFDMDMSLVGVAITDVRMLMARNGLKGTKWTWTDAGWGGDWLGVFDQKQKKLSFSGMKTAYLAHGPCLSDVRYKGYYGSKRHVAIQSTVATLRTDDYARTFQTLEYTFQQQLNAKNAWLFKMGDSKTLSTPQIAYGNRDGLLALLDVPNGLKPGTRFLDKLKLTGEGPWWISFPDGDPNLNKRDWGTGTRALIIRSYAANFDGQAQTNPTITMPVNKRHPDGRVDLDLLLVAPDGVRRFKKGDTVAMDLEWVTLHREADDYYGPNDAYRQHLTENPRSWKTTYREAIGNDLQVVVTGGTLLKSYPVLIQAKEPDISVTITGGVGYVPIRFEGLPAATGYSLYQSIDGTLKALDQSVHGNDFWQTDGDPATGTFKRTYNLPLDGLKTSTWVLKSN